MICRLKTPTIVYYRRLSKYIRVCVRRFHRGTNERRGRRTKKFDEFRLYTAHELSMLISRVTRLKIIMNNNNSLMPSLGRFVANTRGNVSLRLFFLRGYNIRALSIIIIIIIKGIHQRPRRDMPRQRESRYCIVFEKRRW